MTKGGEKIFNGEDMLTIGFSQNFMWKETFKNVK